MFDILLHIMYIVWIVFIFWLISGVIITGMDKEDQDHEV